MDDPTPIAEADVVVVESTYGNRLHKSLATTYDEFAQVLAATLPRGNVIIPAFAVGRTQEVLHVLADLVRQGRAPALTIFVDSPLATRATEITAKYAAIAGSRKPRPRGLARAQQGQGSHPLHRDAAGLDGDQRVTRGAVIVAASGMCEGGRIRHHLRHNLPREECAIVFTGFQAAGTLGREIVDGATRVRLFRDDVPVRASVHTIGGLSAHGDQARAPRLAVGVPPAAGARVRRPRRARDRRRLRRAGARAAALAVGRGAAARRLRPPRVTRVPGRRRRRQLARRGTTARMPAHENGNDFRTSRCAAVRGRREVMTK